MRPRDRATLTSWKGEKVCRSFAERLRARIKSLAIILYFAGALLAVVSPDAVVAYSDAGVTSKLCINEWRSNADTISVNKWNMGR